MTHIAYVRAIGRDAVHISVAEDKWLGADLHKVTLCGQKIKYGYWAEAPRPTETGFESDFRRCQKCDRKRIEGVPAFDYEEELAGRASIHDKEV